MKSTKNSWKININRHFIRATVLYPGALAGPMNGYTDPKDKSDPCLCTCRPALHQLAEGLCSVAIYFKEGFINEKGIIAENV
jgi:hypothetical protein